jgi:L-cystine uptake protein TcyP (sodium:dicarboxylate symporter family)
MSLSEIITAIASLVSILLSGGALAALLQIRSVNAKTLAEAAKIKAEADQLKEQERVSAFNAQILAANTLSNTYAQRLDALTNRITKDEKASDDKDIVIDNLKSDIDSGKQERLKLAKKIDTINRLFNRLVNIVRNYLNYRTACLQKNVTEDPIILKNLESDLKLIEEEFKSVE